MTIGYLGFFVNIKTPASSQEMYELLQISRLMKLKSGAAYAFLFLFTDISVAFFIIPSCSERDNGNCHDRTEKQKRLSFFLKFGSGDRLYDLPENTHDVCGNA